MSPNPWTTLVIVVLTLIGVAAGRFPVIRSNRTTVALIGMALLVAVGQVPFDAIPDYLDFDTLVLLFSMMILNANLKLAGFFDLAGQGLARMARTPRAFLAVEIVLVGVLSALLLNDTVCLMFAPLLLSLMDALKRNPIPYLIALATAANVGSVATFTGNPQNMIIGVASGIPYLEFTAALLPVAALGLGVIWLVLVRMYRYEFLPDQRFELSEIAEKPVNRPLLIKSLSITAGLEVAFLAGVPVAAAAFLAASLLLATRRHKPQQVFAEIDWSLLVFFSALFVVTGSLETSGVTRALIPLDDLARQADTLNLTLLTAALSNLISNVPAVMLLRPVVVNLADPRVGWLTVAAASTLAGNLTLLGSVANLLVAETAALWRVDLSFWEYFKPGFLITLVTLAVSVVYLTMVF